MFEHGKTHGFVSHGLKRGTVGLDGSSQGDESGSSKLFVYCIVLYYRYSYGYYIVDIILY